MTVEIEKTTKEEILEGNFLLTCSNARCMTSWTIKGHDIERIVTEDGKVKCPKCGYMCI